MESQVHVLYNSDFYQIRDFRCGCTKCSLSKLEQAEHFYIIFVREGFYEQRVFRGNHEMHVGRVLVCKPDIEFTVRHIDNQPDTCTSFRFDSVFYDRLKEHYPIEGKWFFNNRDIHSLLLKSNPSIEFLHQHIISQATFASQLEMDSLVIRLVEMVMQTIGNHISPAPLAEGIKKHHLRTIENARDYLFRHFHEDIGLVQLADHCHVSVFHFSRLFKSVLNTTPHQYLTSVRLHHAHLLLQTTSLPITQVAYQSGFNSAEHFATVFRQRFGCSPLQGREKLFDGAKVGIDMVKVI